MELKFGGVVGRGGETFSFNRTFMELKSRNVVSKQGIRKF